MGCTIFLQRHQEYRDPGSVSVLVLSNSTRQNKCWQCTFLQNDLFQLYVSLGSVSVTICQFVKAQKTLFSLKTAGFGHHKHNWTCPEVSLKNIQFHHRKNSWKDPNVWLKGACWPICQSSGKDQNNSFGHCDQPALVAITYGIGLTSSET